MKMAQPHLCFPNGCNLQTKNKCEFKRTATLLHPEGVASVGCSGNARIQNMQILYEGGSLPWIHTPVSVEQS